MAWTPETKHSSDFTAGTKHIGTWDKGLGFLLQEIGAYILQENGGKLVLEESWGFVKPLTWTPQTKH